jgi:hypothetical protein
MPRHQGKWFQQWRVCDRCSFLFPIGMLIQQKGLLVDPKCIDNLDVEFRPKVIAEVLSNELETINEEEQIYQDPQDLDIVF